MEYSTICKKKYQIKISDVDFTKALKMSALFNFFQDIASIDAENLGIGINTLEDKYGVIWIITRFRVDVIRNPILDEEITVETWHHGHRKLDFERDFLVKDLKGHVIALAVSTWMILDIKTREIRKAELIEFNSSPIMKERVINCRLGRIKAFGDLEIVYKKLIGYSDIDFNGHINNSKYVDYAMDCFNVETHKKYRVKSIEINYINEALPEEVLVLCKDLSPVNKNLSYIEGINEKSSKVVFKSQIEFEGK